MKTPGAARHFFPNWRALIIDQPLVSCLIFALVQDGPLFIDNVNTCCTEVNSPRPAHAQRHTLLSSVWLQVMLATRQCHPRSRFLFGPSYSLLDPVSHPACALCSSAGDIIFFGPPRCDLEQDL